MKKGILVIIAMIMFSMFLFGKSVGKSKSMRPVDMGLSVKWATCNIGATKPEEFGNYYAWGEVEQKDFYNWETYKWCDGSVYGLNKYCFGIERKPVNEVHDNKKHLDVDDDIAHIMLGGKWRMPTVDEIIELIYNCEAEWTTLNGVRGCRFISKKNGNSIFLPAAGTRYDDGLTSYGLGAYWSSSVNTGYNPSSASILGFYSLDSLMVDFAYEERSRGLTIRPVSE